jgi:ABC-type polysaccharide/polyol phosphate export permease
VGDGLASLVLSLYRKRALVGVLVGRELQARYRGTVFGYFWSLLNPLLLLAVYTVVFTLVIPARVESQAPYPLFLFAGLLPWILFTGALLDAAVVLPDNGPLLKKVMVEPEVFPAVTVFSHTVHHLLALPVLVGGALLASLWAHFPFPWTLLLLPLVILLWLLTTAGLAFAVAALAVHFRDLKDLLHNLFTLWFFLTPIIYTPAVVPEGFLRRLVLLNPMTPLVTVYRMLAVEGQMPSWHLWLWCLLVACAACALGGFVFSRLREGLAEAV